MQARGKFTREEIMSQPEAWSAALGILKGRAAEISAIARQEQVPHVIFTGCGSTFYLSCAAAVLFQELTGIYARGLPASELWLNPQCSYPSTGSTILIAVSRSGETTETLRACELFARLGKGKLISLVCDPGSSLAGMGALNLVLPSGMERSIAQTRAFSTLYLGTASLSAIWAGRNDLLDQAAALPGLGERILASYSPLAEKLGQDMEIDRIYILGSGGRYGIARELNLKLKEMSLTHSEAFHFLEFRHGPKAMVTPGTLLIGLVSEANEAQEKAVLHDAARLGAQVISMGERNADISFDSGLQEVMRNILYLPFGQVLAYERSIAKGFDPDYPNHLDPVVKLSI